MPNTEQTSNQATSAADKNATDKRPGIATWGIRSRVPVFGAGASIPKAAAGFHEKWLGKMTGNLKKLKQGWATLPERLTGIFGRQAFKMRVEQD